MFTWLNCIIFNEYSFKTTFPLHSILHWICLNWCNSKNEYIHSHTLQILINKIDWWVVVVCCWNDFLKIVIIDKCLTHYDDFLWLILFPNVTRLCKNLSSITFVDVCKLFGVYTWYQIYDFYFQTWLMFYTCKWMN